MLYTTICSFRVPISWDAKTVSTIKESLEDSTDKKLALIVRATKWVLEYQDWGDDNQELIVTVLHSNAGEFVSAIHLNPHLLQMYGDVQEGRHLMNSYNNGAYLNKYMEKHHECKPYTVG